VAALNCRAIGAQSGLPTPDEVEQLLGAGFNTPVSGGTTSD
jgi:hypothetical protein